MKLYKYVFVYAIHVGFIKYILYGLMELSNIVYFQESISVAGLLVEGITITADVTSPVD